MIQMGRSNLSSNHSLLYFLPYRSLSRLYKVIFNSHKHEVASELRNRNLTFWKTTLRMLWLKCCFRVQVSGADKLIYSSLFHYPVFLPLFQFTNLLCNWVVDTLNLGAKECISLYWLSILFMLFSWYKNKYCLHN